MTNQILQDGGLAAAHQTLYTEIRHDEYGTDMDGWDFES